MFRIMRSCLLVSLLAGICVGSLPQIGAAAQHKVLVVMSYEEDMPWVQEMQEGIESILGNDCEIQYFYMDTKTNLEGGPQKAEEAYEQYQTFLPDGVIVADDNAQSMFVVPYLKDEVDTPVMFCGVNAEPEKYGYPASNVSGILERHLTGYSIMFAQQLIPSIKTFGYMIKESPTGNAVLQQMQQEAETYTAEFVAHKFPNTLQEAKTMVEELKEQCDLLLLSTMTGLLDDEGQPLTDAEVIPVLTSIFEKPTVGTEEQVVKNGALCTVVRTGQEQGEIAAEMLLKAMQGTPIAELPITQNKEGKRILNVTVMRSLGIKPKPHVLQGVEFIETEK
jgi:ABC-type uncharacterized transport system substrate-binding protein